VPVRITGADRSAQHYPGPRTKHWRYHPGKVTPTEYISYGIVRTRQSDLEYVTAVSSVQQYTRRHKQYQPETTYRVVLPYYYIILEILRPKCMTECLTPSQALSNSASQDGT
jgi:hypothetical protein